MNRSLPLALFSRVLNRVIPLLLLGAVPVISGAAPEAAAGTPFAQLGARVAADSCGDSLAITATVGGARLQCGFQKLKGNATTEGLWLESTAPEGGEFRVMAMAVSRSNNDLRSGAVVAAESEGGDLTSETGGESEVASTGEVSLTEKLARFVRPGLMEEYSVSMDGVRQDFVVTERPPGTGDLQVGLSVAGASVAPMPGGARLVLERSGRKISYSRLHASDATGRELSTRMELACDSSLRAPHSAPSLALVVVVEDAGAIYPVRIDPTFSDANWISMGGVPGTDDAVLAAVLDAAGNLYIGGSFTVAGEVIANHIAKWDGNAWSPLGSGMNNAVRALAVIGTNLYAGGDFTTAGGSVVSHIARWNGSEWFALGSGMDASVNALAVWNSDLYAGGGFTSAGGAVANRIAKWDGSGWSAVDSGMDNTVIALAAGGPNLYAGGSFTNAGGLPVNCIAKWDGNTWSPLGSGVWMPSPYSTLIFSLAVSGSDLYVGGSFRAAGGVWATNVARWNGSTWSALGVGLSSMVSALLVWGPNLYAAGNDFNLAGASADIATWNGSSWSRDALLGGPNNGASVLVARGSDLYAGGNFTAVEEKPARCIAKRDAVSWSALGSGMEAPVNALAPSASGLYAGGSFHRAGKVAASLVAKWNGSDWSALGPGISAPASSPYFGGSVYAIAVSGSNLYAGGYFTSAGGNPAINVAKWNGSAWSAMGAGLSTVYALAASGSDVYAGGIFGAADGSAPNHVAKWNGSSWQALGSGVSWNGNVLALALSGSNLYVGGSFTAAGGQPAANIAKWNGSSWSTLGLGITAPAGSPYYGGSVSALAVYGTNLYVGGAFTTAGGAPATNIAKWNGSDWSPIGLGIGGRYYPTFNPGVYALAVSGSELYAGGSFTTAGGSPAINIAKWDGAAWSSLGSGMGSYYPWINALAVSGPNLYAGGRFTTAGETVAGSIARAIAVAGDWLRIENGVPGSASNTLHYIGVPNADYLVQFATNLTSSPWFVLVTNTVAADGRGEMTDFTATNAQRFYRISPP